MTSIFIERPALTAGFTALPNALFECATFNLKPRDLAVLNYLLTKRNDWKVNVVDVAKHCCICTNTVYAALKVLQARGITWWRRLKTGKTEWFVRIPESPTIPIICIPESSATPVIEPHTKKPHHQKPHHKFDDVLTKNENKTIIEKTTTDIEPQRIDQPIVVVSEKIVISAEPAADEFKPIPDIAVLEKMDEQHKQAALSALKKVPNSTLQAVILFRLQLAITSGIIRKNPLAYMLGLINKAKNGSLDVRSELMAMKKAQEATQIKPPIPSQTPRNDKAERLILLQKLAVKHPESIVEAQEKGHWHIGGYGLFIRKDFEEAGLI